MAGMGPPITTGAGLIERRLGARGEQKRRWDQDDRKVCPRCGLQTMWRTAKWSCRDCYAKRTF